MRPVLILFCRPLPSHGYVEDYIKAYYLSEVDTEDWVKKHQVILCTYQYDAPGDPPGARVGHCLLYTSPSPRDATLSRMPSSA